MCCINKFIKYINVSTSSIIKCEKSSFERDEFISDGYIFFFKIASRRCIAFFRSVLSFIITFFFVFDDFFLRSGSNLSGDFLLRGLEGLGGLGGFWSPFFSFLLGGLEEGFLSDDFLILGDLLETDF